MRINVGIAFLPQPHPDLLDVSGKQSQLEGALDDARRRAHYLRSL
jgi:hypothetical protein